LLDKALKQFLAVVLEEAERNREFRTRLEDSFADFAARYAESIQAKKQAEGFSPLKEFESLGANGFRTKLLSMRLSTLKVIVDEHNFDPAQTLISVRAKEPIVEKIIAAVEKRQRRDRSRFDY
jgi:hypothetical protein